MYKKNTPFKQDRSEFIKIFGGIYENSSWIAEEVYKKGIKPEYNNAEGLHGAMKRIIEAATKNQKLALLCAHPDLAGKLAISGNLTIASVAEQSSADLSNCTPAEFDLFESLNTRYNKKFGFPFILAVRGYQRAEILEIFKNRINNDIKIEFNEALTQVHRIALLRLKEIEQETI
jgi:2-oxo-4-hydroxy-4-carboxy-5-ureidoimidazoline decarboxylase